LFAGVFAESQQPAMGCVEVFVWGRGPIVKPRAGRREAGRCDV
jgi:hypothetical protein